MTALAAGLVLLVVSVLLWAYWQDPPGGPAFPPTADSSRLQLAVGIAAVLVMLAALVIGVRRRSRIVIALGIAGLALSLLGLVTLGQPAMLCLLVNDCTFLA